MLNKLTQKQQNNMKKIIFTSFFLLTICTFSQVTNEGVPKSWNLNIDDSEFKGIELPTFDLEKVRAEDAINDYKFEAPWRFGFMHSVDYGFDDGVWTTLDNGDRIWRILITSKNALSLNFIFDDFYMPDGAYIYLYNNEKTDLLGAYDSTQNQDSGILGTWRGEGDAVWIEYFEPNEVINQGRLHIAKATHGYRNADTFNEAKGLNDSGNCNLDVDCSIGEDWQELKDHNKRSAGILLSNGSGFCSGALINNTENDGTPYFLTANHCYSNPANWAFRFGWISPNPVCATTQNSTNGPTNMTISGASLRARDAGSDFALVEINQSIPESWDRVFAGWDNSGETPDFTVGIHHPSGDIMKVCRDDNQPIQAINAGAQTWEIVGGSLGGGWEIGVTEPGSSGSPLFDTEGRIIGQLYGGGAACSGTNDNNQFDYYGRIDVSWEGTSSSNRLRDWLDPNDTGATEIDPYPALTLLDYDIGVESIDSPVTGTLTENESVTVSITNFGALAATGFDVSYQIDGGTAVTETYSGSIASEQTVQHTFSTTVDMSVVGTTYSVTAYTTYNGDDDPENDSFTAEVTHLNPNDIGVSEIISPASGTNLSNAEEVTVTITNFGGATQSNFDVSFDFGGVTTTETVEGSIEGNSSVEYTFDQTVDISAFGSYSITAYTSLSNDSDTSNDSITSTINNSNCNPESNCMFNDAPGDGFQLVSIGDINNETGCSDGGYGDFTSISTDLAQGETYDLTVTTNYGSQNVKVWIDFNDDFIFSSDEIVVGDDDFVLGQGQGNVSITATTSVSIPNDAPLGQHIMRLKSNWNANVPDDACEDTDWGETEDYTVNIVESLSIGEFEINYSDLIVYSNDNRLFTLKLRTDFSEILNLSIYDIRGRILSSENINKTTGSAYTHNLDMNQFEAGIYIIKLGNQTVGYKTARIIVR